MSDDLPAGWTTRTPALADVEAVTDLVLACDLDVIGHSDATVEQTASDMAAPGFDRGRGGLLVHDTDGTLVGWLWTKDEPESGSVYVDPYALDPVLTDWLLRRGVDYVRELARQRGSPIAVKAGSYEHDRGLSAALENAGLTVRRQFWRMRIDLAGSDWAMPEEPSGVVLRNPDPAQERTYVELHELTEASFAEHWDHTPRDLAQWRARFESEPGGDPSQWWVADVDGTPAALLIGDDSRAEIGMGWVRILGVLAPFRGRGLGRLLLRTAFAQATALYESVGMRPESVLLAWRGVVSPS